MKSFVTIKASSLLETVIAITIIALCSLLATLVFAQINNQIPPVIKYHYQKELNILINQTIENKDLSPKTVKYSNFTIEKRVQESTYSKEIKNVTFWVLLKQDTLKYPILITNE